MIINKFGLEIDFPVWKNGQSKLKGNITFGMPMYIRVNDLIFRFGSQLETKEIIDNARSEQELIGSLKEAEKRCYSNHR